MGMFDWISFENGKARFCGAEIGADDAPHQVLGVKLGDTAYYGDFETKYEEDGTHYNVEIISFGFWSPTNVGHSSVGVRAVFSPAEVALIQSLICNLIRSSGEQPFPLDVRSRFRGGVFFSDGWIRQKTGRILSRFG